ncbi:MAG: glycosyl hydrolase family 28-related protein [Pyrinomonadaceae bacterium]
MPDFSYAGYHAGEAEIPTPPARWNLKRDFGAKGDGRTDDSQALLNAVRAIRKGVLYVPKGTYVISRRIDISRGDLILRGAGPDETVLYFPKSLTDLFGNTANEAGQSQWSFRPGLINVTGADPITAETRLASVTVSAQRGDKVLRLSAPISVRRGEWIRLVESDPPEGDAAAGTLIRHLYGEIMPPGPDLVGTPKVVRFLSRVKSAAGNRLELERPLPYDVRLEWTPEIHRFVPSVREFGVEHLSLHFPWTPYPGHFKEKGYNGLFLQNVSQCWVRDVEIQNSDFGIDLNSTNFCTVSNVTLTTSADRGAGSEARGMSGHHGIDVSHGTENLVTDFDVRTRFVHDISVEWYALHTVYSKGRGVDLNLDHHREANYSSLFSQIDCGAGTRPFDSGGSRDRGAHAGAYNTYWNIRAAGALRLPPPDFGPLLNFIGVGRIDKRQDSSARWMVEQFAPTGLCPAELQRAMRAGRLLGRRRPGKL